jgi:hypothetical protein
MSEYLRVPKYISAVIAAGIGISALSGCSNEIASWQIGVVCKDGSEAQVGSLEDDPYYLSDNDAVINVNCVDETGKSTTIVGMELVKGEGAIIDSNKDYTNIIEINYDDQWDGYEPEIEFDSATGIISADNVKVKSTAVLE